MSKISAVYKITNTITGDFYIGSSKNIKSRWKNHKCQSTWNEHPNNPMYQDMMKYSLDKFEFQILAEVEEDKLKEKEQEFIEKLKPTYNNYYAKGCDIERCKEYQKEYQKEYKKSDKYKEYQKEYKKSDKYKEYQKEYKKSDKFKEYQKKYQSQLCFYNGQTLTLNALQKRFRRQGLSNPTEEAKKYIKNNNPIEFYDVYP